jgi:hypothetical protein
MDRMTRPLLLCAAAFSALAVTSPAQANPESIAYFTQGKSGALPTLLTQQDRFYYASFFEAVDARNWDRVEILLGERSEGPLHGAALAEYYLHPESPRIPLERLQDWLGHGYTQPSRRAQHAGPAGHHAAQSPSGHRGWHDAVRYLQCHSPAYQQ